MRCLSRIICFVVKRQDEAADKADKDKNVTDTAPGLGGTNIRFPSKL